MWGSHSSAAVDSCLLRHYNVPMDKYFLMHQRIILPIQGQAVYDDKTDGKNGYIIYIWVTRGLTGQCGWQSDQNSSDMHWVGPRCTGRDDCCPSLKLRVTGYTL